MKFYLILYRFVFCNFALVYVIADIGERCTLDGGELFSAMLLGIVLTTVAIVPWEVMQP